LAGLWFESADESLEAVQPDLKGVEKGTLRAVFLERIDRLRKYIATGEDYTD
jgi:hypothetical protein